jgi:hypothetical protein
MWIPCSCEPPREWISGKKTVFWVKTQAKLAQKASISLLLRQYQGFLV